MNEFGGGGGGGGGGRFARPWNFYPSSDPAEPSPPRTGENYNYRQAEPPWKSFGTTSMNAISFGFVATAILISMFLIMAILEHLFRPDLSLITSSSSSSMEGGIEAGSLESGSGAKIGSHDMVMARYATGLSSVVMPGQKYPTCIAQPAPLLPFTREGIPWPPHHQHTFAFS